jgi:hypothetical protein
MAKKTRKAAAVKGQVVVVQKCTALKVAIARELKTQVKDAKLRNRLLESLSGEVAYNTGGGGGIGVA